MLPRTAPSDRSVQKEKDKDERRKIIFALLFLLLSFSCIFCSSQSALWLINRDRVEASIRSNLSADYGFDPALALAPLSEEIISEAEQDEAALLARQTPLAVGLGIAILPNPIPTPEPTAITLLPTLLPTPTPAAPSNPAPAPATPAAPTATQGPQPTSPSSTSTSAPPATSPPTMPATVPPTVPATTLPTVPPTVPPTIPPTIPATIPPTVAPTVPSTAVPPTATATPTDIPTATATHTPTSTPTPPTVAFSGATFNINENGGNAAITVLLSASSGQTVTVNYASLTGGTATLGGDYTPVSGLLTFSPGQTNQIFNIPVINDAIANEGDETVLLELSTPVNATLGLNNATLIITDDDPSPSVQFSSDNHTIAEANTTVPIDVTLTIASALTVTVNYTTSNQTAEDSSDYIATSGTLTFAPGVTSQAFSVTIIDDTLDEPDETVRLTLTGPVNATLGPTNPARLTIIDNDTDIGLCAGLYPAGEPNVGSPNEDFIRVGCGTGLIVDLSSDPINRSGDGSYDLVYYEVKGYPPPSPPNQIFLDWVIVQIGQSSGGPWYEVFNWGDGGPDANTNIGTAPPPGPYSGPEDDNTLIPMTTPPLYGTPLTTGITIDIDAPLNAAGAPSGAYQYVRILSPIGDANGPEIDAIEAIP